MKILKVVLINIIAILMKSAKLATPHLLKMTVYWNKGYDVIISAHDIIKKIFSRDSNYIVNVVMWSSLVALAFPWEKLL